MRTPAASDAKALLSLAAWTLLLLPNADESATHWRQLANEQASAHDKGPDAVASTAQLELSIAAEGCVDSAVVPPAAASPMTVGRLADRCAVGASEVPSLKDGQADAAMLIETKALRRLNAHHYSCWHSPRCHQRMYATSYL